MLKRILTLTLCLMLMLGTFSIASADMLSDIQAKGTLVVGAEVSFPPYEFYFLNPETNEEELSGFEMALAQGLAAELGVEFKLVEQQFAGLITALRAGDLDVIISGMSIKPDRQEQVDFSDPYYSGTQIMLVRKDDVDKYKVPEDFNKLSIGAQTGSLQHGVAEEQFTGANHVLLDKVPLLVMELRLGNVEGVLLTDNVALSYITLFPDEIAISEVPIVYTSPGVAVAIRKDANNASFIEFVNTYIAKVKADGTFDAWLTEAIEKNGKLLEADTKE